MSGNIINCKVREIIGSKNRVDRRKIDFIDYLLDKSEDSIDVNSYISKDAKSIIDRHPPSSNIIKVLGLYIQRTFDKEGFESTSLYTSVIVADIVNYFVDILKITDEHTSEIHHILHSILSSVLDSSNKTKLCYSINLHDLKTEDASFIDGIKSRKLINGFMLIPYDDIDDDTAQRISAVMGERKYSHRLLIKKDVFDNIILNDFANAYRVNDIKYLHATFLNILREHRFTYTLVR